jgi:Flp pilus assembly protein TadD
MTGRALLLTFLLTGSVAAQFDSQPKLRRITIRIVASNSDACDVSTRVTLRDLSGPAAVGSPNSDCEVPFTVPAGTYQVTVSGSHVAPVDTRIAIEAGGPSEVDVRVESSSAHSNGVSDSPVVGIAELSIPSGAKKEFAKANELMGKQDFEKAIQRLNKAIAIYPTYAGAYNNLAVIYAHLGDSAQEQQALKKALSIDDHFAPAYVNLGRMNIKAGNFREAEAALSKASSLDPNDAMTMVLLTYVEFMDRHLDEAIATSRKAHSLPQGQHAFVHQVAARAYEQKHQAASAIAELELFLKEEQSGPRAEIARKELAGLRTGPR